MIRASAFCASLSIDEETLEIWTASGWLLPAAEEEAGEPGFTEADAARGRFILALQADMGVNAEGIGLVLDLVDQIHGLRGTLAELMAALEAQPEDVRQAILGSTRR
jgi:chaperone modulatory protein CbpM